MKTKSKRCATCGEEPFEGGLPPEHEQLPAELATCPDCGGPLLALWPID